jgi:hypothetical protein
LRVERVTVNGLRLAAGGKIEFRSAGPLPNLKLKVHCSTKFFRAVRRAIYYLFQKKFSLKSYTVIYNLLSQNLNIIVSCATKAGAFSVWNQPGLINRTG